tara:strand:- start:564 stop:782 length:219 start_codon:yes stop_codon:yes gene_type:complete
MTKFNEFMQDAEKAYIPLHMDVIRLNPETHEPTKDEFARLHNIFDPIGKKHNTKVVIHYCSTFGLTVIPTDL